MNVRRAVLLGILIGLALAGCTHSKPQTKAAPKQQASEWWLSNEARDGDTICSQTFEDGPFRHCKTVGDVRAFLRSANAEP